MRVEERICAAESNVLWETSYETSQNPKMEVKRDRRRSRDRPQGWWKRMTRLSERMAERPMAVAKFTGSGTEFLKLAVLHRQRRFRDGHRVSLLC